MADTIKDTAKQSETQTELFADIANKFDREGLQYIHSLCWTERQGPKERRMFELAIQLGFRNGRISALSERGAK